MIYLYFLVTIAVVIVAERMHDVRAKRIVYLVLGLALVFAPLLDHNDANYNILADAGVFVLLALGLNIVVGFAGLLDLGYAAFFAIGAYTYGILASPQFGIHLPFWALLFVAAALAALFGIILGAPTLRLHGDYLAIVTLGFGEIVPQIFQNLTKYTGGPNGISALDFPSFFGRSFGQRALPYYYVTLALIALGLFFANNLRDSRLGRAWMAIREDELAARHMGINSTLVKLAAFALGASFSGLGGVVFASKLSLVSPDLFQFQVSVLIVSMLVLGGMGNIPGVIVGSLLLTLVNNVALPEANTIATSFGLHVDFSNYHFFIYGAILVGIMLFKPEGLLPSRQRRAELRHAAVPESATP
ncbi:MAG: branched-chain amino acid ABC transporter permease [Vulcanimicrobiaceae bacterium]